MLDGTVKTAPAAGLVSATAGPTLLIWTVVDTGADDVAPSFTMSVTVKVPSAV